jgi:TatD DNase family protein
MHLVDIGVNLTNARLFHDRATLRQQALEAGVIHQVITGTCYESSLKAQQITTEHPDYYSSTAGFHPHDAKDYTEAHYQQLKALAQQPGVVAIGECGLDFNRNFSPPDTQVAVFEQQIQLAVETGLPLFLHQRDAHDTFISLLKPYAGQVSGVCHCFTGTIDEQADYLDLGFYIGITGWLCDERRGQSLQEAASYTPAERLLLETDSPYLLPRTIRPRPKKNLNVPAYLPWVINYLADLRKTESHHLAEQILHNSRQLFQLPC